MKHFNRFSKVFFFLLMLVLLASDRVGANPIRISIPEKVGISSEWITLGEIASITGASGQKLASLQAINLGKAVFPGYSREIYRGQIELVLKNEGFSLDDIVLDCPERIIVETKSRKIDGADLVEAAKKHIIEALDYPAEQIIVRVRQQIPEIILPDRDFQLKFEGLPGGSRIGNITLQAHIIIDDLVYRRVYLPFEVLVKQQVYLARRPIGIGETINPEDFVLTEIAVGNIAGDIITNLDTPLVTFGIVRTPIPQDAVLTSRYLRMPDLIKAGDEVQAEVIIGNVRVSVKVKARQNGKYGDYIIVENTSTGHRFKAQVISSYLVRVINPGSS